jgi:hypothetical protein
VSLSAFLGSNLLPVTLGNIAGGACVECLRRGGVLAAGPVAVRSRAWQRRVAAGTFFSHSCGVPSCPHHAGLLVAVSYAFVFGRLGRAKAY